MIWWLRPCLRLPIDWELLLQWAKEGLKLYIMPNLSSMYAVHCCGATGHIKLPFVRLQNLPWSKTGLVSRQGLHPLSKLQNWIWSKTGRYKTGLVSNTKIEASLRATKPKPWQSNLNSDTVEIFIQNEKAGLVPMQSRFRSRHKAGFGAAGLGTAQSWFWSRHKTSFGAVWRPV